MDDTTIEIAKWLFVISVVPAIIAGLAWRSEKLSTGLFGVAIGLAIGGLFVLARY